MPKVGTPAVEQRRVDARGALGVDRRRAAREDDRDGPPGQHLRHRHRVRDDLAVDARLADPPGDQLGVLRAEVDDEDRRVEPGRHESATTSAFWKSFRLS